MVLTYIMEHIETQWFPEAFVCSSHVCHLACPAVKIQVILVIYAATPTFCDDSTLKEY